MMSILSLSKPWRTY